MEGIPLHERFEWKSWFSYIAKMRRFHQLIEYDYLLSSIA